jgi:hypothetical protein
MTWTSFHRRGEILRDVITSANRRRDGLLPLDVPGVHETFPDELSLIGALQLRWHTRLAGRIDRELMQQPLDLEQAVVSAWQATADELPGIRAIIDRQRTAPADSEIAAAMEKSASKEHILLAMMAGRVSAPDATAARVGAGIEERARATYVATSLPTEPEGRSLLGRLKAALAA